MRLSARFAEGAQRRVPGRLVRVLSVVCYLFVLSLAPLPPTEAIIFDEVSSIHVWITISSLANKDPNSAKALLFRQVELNWINAPLEDENDYIGLYLDGEPDGSSLPVSVHRLNGQSSGQIITDYYLPLIDFYNETQQATARWAPDQRWRRRTTGPAGSGADELGVVSSAGSSFVYEGAPSSPLGSAPLPPASSAGRALQSQCLGYCLAYHSREKILAHNCLRTSPNWMQDSFQFIGGRSLPTLMIPGTHNSATYQRQLDKTALHMINKYQLNQDESIFNQLVHGIRHLDLRVGYSKVRQRSERLWIYHDIFRTELSVSEVFEQVRRFLELTSHEIIIMDFHRFTVGFENEDSATQRERHARLIELIFKHFSHYIVPAYLGQHAPLNEYVASGKRLIIGYAAKSLLVGSQPEFLLAIKFENGHASGQQQVRDIDAIMQDQDSEGSPVVGVALEASPRTGSRWFSRLKAKLVSNTFPRKPDTQTRKHATNLTAGVKMTMSDYDSVGAHEWAAESQRAHPPLEAPPTEAQIASLISRAGLFFPPVRHLWPNRDTIEGLAHYMNETTCRRYFGELRSLMVELTPTVFGVLADKYDGNRKLAQLVNRPVTDWIRDRWLHCVNIVASDFFLGNDLVRLSISANKMRVTPRSLEITSFEGCSSFIRVEHLLDKSKIPIQFTFQAPSQSAPNDLAAAPSAWNRPAHARANQPQPADSLQNQIVTHTSPDGNQFLLKPLTSGLNTHQMGSRDKRDNSFVENVSDGFTNLFSSFKKLFNL